MKKHKSCVVCKAQLGKKYVVTAAMDDKIIWRMCFFCYNGGILWAAAKAHNEAMK